MKTKTEKKTRHFITCILFKGKEYSPEVWVKTSATTRSGIRRACENQVKTQQGPGYDSDFWSSSHSWAEITR